MAEHKRHFGAFADRFASIVLGNNASVEEFVIKVIALTRPLANASKHRNAAVALRDIVDEFLNKNRLANTSAAEQADLTALCVRREQIDHLNAGHKDRSIGGLVNERRGFCVDRRRHIRTDGAALVNGFANDIHDPAKRLGANRHRNLSACGNHFAAAGEAFGRIHRDGAHSVFAKMLSNFENQRLLAILGLKR